LLIGQTPDISYGATLREKAAAVPGLQLQMYGKFSRHELPHLLRGVDCVVVPSLVPEAGPIVPREALGLGVPVLASKLGALPELIAEGENGYTFNPRTSGELAAIFRQLTCDETLLDHLRAGARRSPVVTLAAHAERVRAVYERAIQDFRSRCANSTSVSELEFLHKTLIEQEHGRQMTLTVGQRR
jgi:glycosyltransferase involved in cell wall biosynthesis